ncbi:MAG: aryl-alcohol dehydrogenase-like predicted oxidoreductase [Myxococcota bacterium]|jgi:aryl-alcohol dehydrogenase-like predicted oxidoreductase
MSPIQLGRSGLRVSPMCLGTMMFGGTADLATARQIADRCLDRGVFFWDTADMYGKGASETVCGALLKGRRQEVVLATKVFADMGPGVNDRGLSARNILSACDASLRRLGTDYIDLYYLHLPDRAVPLDETLRAMEDLVRSGRVRYVGCSNYRSWEIVELIHTAKASGFSPVIATQPLYNIVNRDIEVELLPMAERYGLGVVSYSSLARGVLTGKYTWGAAPPKNSRLDRADPRFLRAEWRQDSVEVAAALVPLAQARGCTPSQLATAWAMANQRVHSVIIGPRTVEQAEESLGAAEVVIDAELETAVDALVPPGSHSGRGWPDADYYPVTGRAVQ